MGLFSPDSRLVRFLERFADVLILNLLWLAFSLPIVTIGASTVAAYSVALKMVDDEECYIARSFVKAFKSNFRQGTLLWVLNAAGLYALYLDWQIVTKAQEPSVFLAVAGIISAVFVFCAFVYAYPLTARYDNSLGNMIRNSFKITFRYFVKTLILIVVLTLEIVVFMWNRTMAFFGLIVGPMILIYTVSGISKRIFQDIDRKKAASGP
jgi:uncharacterized membrane protein YesL